MFGFGRGPYPERKDAGDNRVDRWLGALTGRVNLWLAPMRIARLRQFAARVMQQSASVSQLGEQDLREQARALGVQMARQGLLADNVVQVFALVREVCGRQLGMRHYPVQLMGGKALLEGKLAEMETGEGKTLTAALPAIAVALAGIPVHVITVNEYLAARDAEFLRPVYEFFGLSVGLIVPDQDVPTRRLAYRCDVVYCVNKDLVFDYLRDRISFAKDVSGARRAVIRLFGKQRGQASLLKGLFFAIVDEADSVLIDEARTPLIISSSIPDQQGDELYRLALAQAATLQQGLHYRVHEIDKGIALTPAGRQQVAADCAALGGVWTIARAREELIEQALAACHLYQRDRQYIVSDGKIQIVDEYTGRVMADRSWERGLHQMIEVKENCALSDRRETISRITYQRFFRRYLRFAGMTGTAREVAPELRSVYGIDVIKMPTNQPGLRRNLGTRLFARSADRWHAVVAAIAQMHARGRPVLVGTRSVAASEQVSALLMQAGIAHQVLNARQDSDEARVIEAAGVLGAVTVATNMAGRGTDIKLSDEVKALGGLHVVLTEFHESARIDRQLYGRVARQGDPGSFESIVSLQDDLFQNYAHHLSVLLEKRLAVAGTAGALEALMLRRLAQFAAERHFSAIRRQTVLEDGRLEKMLAFAGSGE